MHFWGRIECAAAAHPLRDGSNLVPTPCILLGAFPGAQRWELQALVQCGAGVIFQPSMKNTLSTARTHRQWGHAPA